MAEIVKTSFNDNAIIHNILLDENSTDETENKEVTQDNKEDKETPSSTNETVELLKENNTALLQLNYIGLSSLIIQSLVLGVLLINVFFNRIK